MIAIHTNRINCESGVIQDIDLPIDLRAQLISLRPLLVNLFQVTDYHLFLLEADSISLMRKGTLTTKSVSVIPQPTVQLLNSVIEKVANL